jgi:flagellar biosynthesis activator protein FlaF
VTPSRLLRTAYARPDAPTRAPRDVEYDLLSRVTGQLARSWANRVQDFPALARALNDNLRLWRVFAADVAEPGNALPDALRARLFYLYEFASQHSPKVLDHGASAEVLIDINTAVLRGLRGEGVAA